MRECNSRLFRQKLELLDYNFKIIYRPGAQNHVADALSRIEPLTINEMLDFNKETQIFVATRAQTKANETPRNLKYTIEERDGVILNKRNYDLIFHLISEENYYLKTKLMDKFGLTVFSKEWKLFNKVHYYRLISNQFANCQNEEAIEDCIQNFFEFSKENRVENIAINLDFDNVRIICILDADLKIFSKWKK